MQNVALFCHLVQSCSVVISDVEGCTVDFKGSQKCSVDKIKFLLFEENIQSSYLKKMLSRFARALGVE